MYPLTTNSLIHDTYARNSPYFLDHIFTPEECHTIRKMAAFRFAADIIARGNAVYTKYNGSTGTNHGDIRLRIIGNNAAQIYLGDITGAMIAKVYQATNPEGNTEYVFEASHQIKERGTDNNRIISVKSGFVIKSLYAPLKGRPVPRLLWYINHCRERHTSLILSNHNHAYHKLMQQNPHTRPTESIYMDRNVAAFLLKRFADPDLVPTIETLKEINDYITGMDNYNKYEDKAKELLDDAFGSDRWCVIRSAAGYYITRVKVNINYIIKSLYGHMHFTEETASLTMPSLFVRTLDQIANVRQDLYEQFMGAFTMMRACEPTLSNFAVHMGDQFMPFADNYFKNSTACSYFSTGGDFSGGVSLSFRAFDMDTLA